MSDAQGQRQEVKGKPLVARLASPRLPGFGWAVAAIAALLLFIALEARRASSDATGPTRIEAAGAAMIASPPDLFVPEPTAADTDRSTEEFEYGLDIARPPIGRAAAEHEVDPAYEAPASRRTAPSSRSASPQFADEYVPPPTIRDRREDRAPMPRIELRAAQESGEERVQAKMLANPATTVAKGAMIHAVLETALDSSWGGPVKAIVSRDVRGFDGTAVLVPRGSRLYGQYKPDLAPGQGRMLIHWERLTRPDGAIIALDSPSADPLGRAGVKGRVNSHFFERFGASILQSVLDVGVAAAGRNHGLGPVVVGLPGSTQRVSQQPVPEVRRTIKVRQGTAVSVFVSRDLDFTPVQK